MRVIQAKVCLIGDFAVGKTSLVRRYVEGRFDDRYLSTIGVKISRKTLDRDDLTLKLLIWDLAGGEGFSKYEANYLRGARGAVVVCDLTRRETLGSFGGYVAQFRDINPEAALIFVANKLDLTGDREIPDDELAETCIPLGGPYLVTSARTGDQVEAVFEMLGDHLESSKR